ncbi:BadF/BadG/BcrA/BcrD ATPase family protein [Anaeromyxobacter oryzae]|uniref:2-hydroxyglutaryl-CoA dehydratase n=1 Tax=Anaeromyxobacter oryzae TaxID=2918170 RepID=A0ABM7X0Y4_9BACT|nr:BadF/BadG/BcrA/BcrD ATPase family protein [Anaeromyxobacter oryzae]BDG05410.1 2-hydroxyglutaryl-CoA dehydratase [Anaeromyxobacter oryzae]
MTRHVGIDLGAETIKIVELAVGPEGTRLVRRALVPHGKAPGPRLVEALAAWDWDGVARAAVTGRLGRQVALERVPQKGAVVEGVRLLLGPGAVTVVTIGSRGISVVELPEAGEPSRRESARCAQGTGNFLRQLVERFGLGVEEAAARAAAAPDAAPLSGRCPVILKTDMTHLANKGEPQDRILAGLFDAIAESAEALVKPRRCPPRVVLAGGVARAERVRDHVRRFLEARGMTLVDLDPELGVHLDAAGCAVHAARLDSSPPPLDALLRAADEARVDRLPPLRGALGRVRRLSAGPALAIEPGAGVVLGLDVGSTGSKAVALDLARGAPVWEGYLRTRGDPVGAAQALVRAFLDGPAAAGALRGFGATGSGREIVGSLLATCYGADAVFVLNEIAAHARGALHHDPRVDTIFEIGGQDAKYIRLDHGRVVDAAMNEACSAGTGSFIEEQGRRFEGVDDVARLGEIALGAEASASLGQHCSIFMAEVIDEAIAAGVPHDGIVAGLYESVIANYLNRVKGSRSVGEVVFCQGMPFSADALAAAVARQTGAEVVVPPSPGTVGALGIALLAADAAEVAARPALDPQRFLAAHVERKDTFVCGSAAGCGGAGNKCRIDRLTTVVEGAAQRFTWGGGCALHDKGTRRAKLPEGTPDPFRARAALTAALVERLAANGRNGERVALVDAFQLRGMLPFFATFVDALGHRVEVRDGGGRAALKRGAEGANVPFCAPMQQFHGAVAALAESDADRLLVPLVREVPRVGDERASQLCPVVQGSPDVLRWDLGAARDRLVAPVFDVGAGALDSPGLLESCRRLATDLGVRGGRWRDAWAEARAAQLEFDARLLDAGREALARCEADGLLPVVVLGRTYTIHDEVLNSNVPAILREQGAVAIPVDAYPVDPAAPLFPNMYWGHGQRILRAAWQIRRTPGPYALFASNYSCGPDSFTLHLFAALMEGKPFAVIETDGHAGDAGTKTRVEAFLHCAREHRAGGRDRAPRPERRLTVRSRSLRELVASGDRILVPSLGPAAEVVAEALRGTGANAEALPDPGPAALAIGRRHTSGKECLPMILTLGSLLERVERPGAGTERFAFLMPGTDGPCRFGTYKEVHQLVLDRLGHGDRVSIWSPPFGDYFQGVQPGFGALVLAGVAATDLLRDALHDVRPREVRPGVADAIWARHHARLLALVRREGRGDLSVARVLREVGAGRVWGVPALLAEAAADLAAASTGEDLPLVQVVGEIYVRNVPIANGHAVDALARRGIRARISPVTEFLQYSDWLGVRGRRRTLAGRLDAWVRRRIERSCEAPVAAAMGWETAPYVRDVVRSARDYLRDAVEGEAVLTLGASLHAWRRRQVDAVLSVGPLECMPNKLAETQLVHAGEAEGLLSLTLSLNGDPVDPESLEAFAFEVHARARHRRAGRSRLPPPPHAVDADGPGAEPDEVLS